MPLPLRRTYAQNGSEACRPKKVDLCNTLESLPEPYRQQRESPKRGNAEVCMFGSVQGGGELLRTTK